MKILFVSPHIPHPLTNGGRIRTANLLKHLVKEHAVTLVCINRDLADDEALGADKQLESVGISDFHWFKPDPLLRAFTRSRTISTVLSRYYSKKLSDFIRTNHNDYAVVLLDGLHSSINYQLKANDSSIHPVFLLEQNVEYDLLQQRRSAATFPTRWLLDLEARFVRNYELNFVKRANAVFCVSGNDMEKITERLPGRNIYLAPNGVDTDFFAYQKTSNENRLIFVGSGLYWPNIDAINTIIKEILPKIWRKNPNVKMMFVGREIDHTIKDADDLRMMRIEVHSNVPDIRPFIHSACAFLVPLRFGSGTRVKVLEAMALGCPVISTRKGVEGIDGLVPGINYLESETAQEFSDRIAFLLNNPSKAAEIVLNARSLIESNYNWDTLLRPLDAQLKAIV